MKKTLFVLACMTCIMGVFTSCKKEKSDEPKKEEITSTTVYFKGVVTDADNQTPISQVTITLTPGNIFTYTGEDGSYNIETKCTTDNVQQDGKWGFTIAAQKNGYKTNRKSIADIVSSDFGKSYQVDISLRKE